MFAVLCVWGARLVVVGCDRKPLLAMGDAGSARGSFPFIVLWVDDRDFGRCEGRDPQESVKVIDS